MKMTLPLHYSVDAIPFRHRMANRIGLVDFVVVDVPEVLERDAPEVVAVHAHGASERIRWHGGKFWMEDETSDPERRSLRSLVGGLKNRDSHPSHFQNANWGSRIPSNGQIVEKTVESERCRNVTWNNRDACLADLQRKAAQDLTFIGDVLHVAVPEPFVVIVSEENKESSNFFRTVCLGNPNGDGHFLNQGKYAYMETMREFVAYSVAHADEADEAEAFLVASGTEVDRVGMVEALEGFPSAEFSETRTEERDVLATANSVMRRAKWKMSDWPTADAMRWFALRDAIRHGDGNPAAETVAAALEDLSAVYDVGPWARLQIERWRMRPLDAGPGYR